MAVSSQTSPVFGSFTLLAKLARGDIGDLFLARSQGAGGFEKLVIIKRVHSELMKDPEISRIFYQEARAAAHIEHPNVRMVYEIGNNQEHHYIALEYLEGIPLVDVLLARRRYPKLADTRFIASLLSQACEGLHAAHIHRFEDKIGRTHGDLNPRSLFITATGTTKILDFDIAGMRISLAGRHGFIRRTNAYMSPEEIDSGKSDPRSDVFSLGAVAWEAITGRRLFKRGTQEQTLRAIARENVPAAQSVRPDIGDALNSTILRALSKDPSLRFQSARDFGAALERALQAEGPPLTPLTISAQLQSAFAEKLKQQRAFVRAARSGKSESETLVRRYQSHSEEQETVVAPPIEETDEWESDFNVATKVVDYQEAMSVIAQALEKNAGNSLPNSPVPTESDPFHEVTKIVDFSGTDVSTSWGDTQSLILSTLDLPDETGETKSTRAATKLEKVLPQKGDVDFLGLEETPHLGGETKFPAPVIGKTLAVLPLRNSMAGPRRLIAVLLGATFLVIAAIVIVMLLGKDKEGSEKAQPSSGARFDAQEDRASALPDHSLDAAAAGLGVDREGVAVDAAGPDVDASTFVDAGYVVDASVASGLQDPVRMIESIGMGTLRISSTKPARLFIDGKRKGTTPTKILLTAERHKLRLVHRPSGKSKTIYVEVLEAKETRVRIRL